MSWGATAFTPIITYNTPPFGFEERPNPSDFGTCPEDPYSASENLKENISHLFKLKDATIPYSPLEPLREFFGETKTIFTFYNVVLFVMVVFVLVYMTRVMTRVSN